VLSLYIIFHNFALSFTIFDFFAFMQTKDRIEDLCY